MAERHRVFNNVLEAIGDTPVVRLNRVTEGFQSDVYVKLEFMNPGGSVKDRIAHFMLEKAEERGDIARGGTVVEGTSGNTGMGLAMAAAIKGYQAIFVMPDKQSIEKVQALRAFGAKVVVTPTAVEPDDPRAGELVGHLPQGGARTRRLRGDEGLLLLGADHPDRRADHPQHQGGGDGPGGGHLGAVATHELAQPVGP